MVLCRLRREEYNEAKIMVDSMVYNTPRFPKAVKSSGSSFAKWLNPELIFKRKLQDGNQNVSWASAHHDIYDESMGTFDDLAEVMCYQLAKNMGTTVRLDNFGKQVETPVVGCAEYRLATFLTKAGYEERGCVSKNVLAQGERMFYGCDVLNYLKTPENQNPKNSLVNYMKALPIYAEHNGIGIECNFFANMMAHSFFCWKTANSDNHSNNVTLIQTLGPDGKIYASMSYLIDNGSSWECSSPCVQERADGSLVNRYKELCEKNLSPTEKNEDGSPKVVFTQDPFKHTAFSIDAGNLNGHSKVFKGSNYSKKLDLETQKKLTYEYEYDLAAVALADPEVYKIIYEIESKFDINRAIEDVGNQYKLNWPEGMKEVMVATSQFKTDILSKVMADYYTYTAYTSCFGQIDQDNPPENFTKLQEEMQKLPLQQSCQHYQQAFLQVASQNNIKVDAQKLETLNFIPDFGLPQTESFTQVEQPCEQ